MGKSRFFLAGLTLIAFGPAFANEDTDALFSALTQRHPTLVEQNIRSLNLDMTQRTADGSYLIHAATRGNRLELIRQLKNRGADLNSTDHQGRTPLHYAAELQYPEVLSMLLELGANPNLADNLGQTPLHLASRGKSLAIAKALLQRNAERNAQDQDGNTPAHLAAQAQNLAVLVQLILAKADPSAVNNAEKSVWEMADHAAAERAGSSISTSSSLLTSRSYEEEFGTSPGKSRLKSSNAASVSMPLVHSHAQSGNLDLLASVLSDCDVNVVDADQATPLHKAAQCGQSVVVDFLLRANAKFDAKDVHGITPILAAIRANQMETFKQLLLCYSDAPLTSKEALMADIMLNAAKYASRAFVTHLLALDFPINAQDSRGQTPLMIAAQLGRQDVVELLARKANLQTPDRMGQTVLHHAARTNQLLLFAYLVAKGANIYSKSKSGQTALEVAQARGFREFTEIFEAILPTTEEAAMSSGQRAAMRRALAASNNPQRLLLRQSSKGGNYLHGLILGNSYSSSLRPSHGSDTPRQLLAHVQLLNPEERSKVINCEDNQGMTPAHTVFFQSEIPKSELLDALIQQGADFNRLDSEGYSPLMYAIEQQEYEAIRTLIAHGANLNLLNPKGITALHLAAELGDRASLILLLQHGADPCLSGRQGTAYHRLTPKLRAEVDELAGPLLCAIPAQEPTSNKGLSADAIPSRKSRRFFLFRSAASTDQVRSRASTLPAAAAAASSEPDPVSDPVAEAVQRLSRSRDSDSGWVLAALHSQLPSVLGSALILLLSEIRASKTFTHG